MNEQLTYKQLHYLMQVSNILNSTLDSKAIIESIIQEIISIIEVADVGILFLYDEEENVLISKSSYGFNQNVIYGTRLKPGESMTGMTFQQKKPLMFKNRNEVIKATGKLTGFNYEILQASLPELPYSAICAPIIVSDDCLGVITLDSLQPDKTFTQEDLNLLEAISHQAAVALERSHLYKEKEKTVALLSKLNKTITQQNTLLARSVDTHKKLSNLVVKGENLNVILIHLYKTIGTPLILTDSFGDIIDYQPRSLEPVLPDLLEAIQPFPSGGFFEERLIDLPASGGRKLETFPIGSKHNRSGYLAALSPAPLSEIDTAALEHACTILSLELVKEQDLHEMEQKLKGEFLEELVTGKVTSRLLQQAKNLDFDPNNLYRIIILQLVPFHSEEETEKSVLRKVNREILQVIRQTYGRETMMAVNRNNHIIILLSEKEEHRSEMQFIEERNEKLTRFIKKKGLSPIIGTGGEYRGIEHARESFQEALKTVEFLKTFTTGHSSLSYQQMGASRLFMENSEEQLISFIIEKLGPLLMYDLTAGKEEYFPTFERYLSNGHRVKETAQQMHIHSNTLTYRLKKIEELLDCNLNQFSDRTDVYIAVTLYGLMKEKADAVIQNRFRR